MAKAKYDVFDPNTAISKQVGTDFANLFKQYAAMGPSGFGQDTSGIFSQMQNFGNLQDISLSDLPAMYSPLGIGAQNLDFLGTGGGSQFQPDINLSQFGSYLDNLSGPQGVANIDAFSGVGAGQSLIAAMQPGRDRMMQRAMLNTSNAAPDVYSSVLAQQRADVGAQMSEGFGAQDADILRQGQAMDFQQALSNQQQQFANQQLSSQFGLGKAGLGLQGVGQFNQAQLGLGQLGLGAQDAWNQFLLGQGGLYSGEEMNQFNRRLGAENMGLNYNNMALQMMMQNAGRHGQNFGQLGQTAQLMQSDPRYGNFLQLLGMGGQFGRQSPMDAIVQQQGGGFWGGLGGVLGTIGGAFAGNPAIGGSIGSWLGGQFDGGGGSVTKTSGAGLKARTEDI